MITAQRRPDLSQQGIADVVSKAAGAGRVARSEQSIAKRRLLVRSMVLAVATGHDGANERPIVDEVSVGMGRGVAGNLGRLGLGASPTRPNRSMSSLAIAVLIATAPLMSCARSNRLG